MPGLSLEGRPQLCPGSRPGSGWSRQAEYRALDKIVKKLTPADFRRPAMREEAPIRFSAKDVLAHSNAWKWRQVRVVAKDKGPIKPNEPPRFTNIRDSKALRGLPSDYFKRERSTEWPFDAGGHVAEHTRKHLEPLAAARERVAR